MLRWAAPLVGLAANLSMLWGVVFGGWPPGNMWLVFWTESVAVGVSTWLRLRVDEGKGVFGWTPSRAAASDSSTGWQTWAPPGERPPKRSVDAQFFALFYGIFTGVAGVFAIVSAVFVGVRPDLTLWVPLALVLVRFASEISEVTAGQVRPRGLLAMTFTRMGCLHLGVILGFGCAIAYVAGGEYLPTFSLGGHYVDSAMLSVLILLALKTVAELVVTLVLVARGR